MRLYVDKCDLGNFTNHHLIENRLNLEVHKNEEGYFVDETDLISILETIDENIESVQFIKLLNELGVCLKLSWEFDKNVWHDYDGNYFGSW